MTSFADMPVARSGGPGLVARLRAEWRQLTAQQETLDVLARWAVREPPLAGVDLVGCDWRQEPPERRDAILLTLIRLGQHTHPLAARVVLQAMLPAAGRMAGRLTWVRDQDSREAAVVAGMAEAIASYRVDRRVHRVAANLLHEAWHAAVRESSVPGEVLMDPHLLGTVSRHRSDDRDTDAYTELVAMLVTAVQDGVFTVSDSQFLLDTAGYGGCRSYACRTQIDVQAVYRRRHALLRRLSEKYGHRRRRIRSSKTH